MRNSKRNSIAQLGSLTLSGLTWLSFAVYVALKKPHHKQRAVTFCSNRSSDEKKDEKKLYISAKNWPLYNNIPNPLRLKSGRYGVRIPLAPGFFSGSSHTSDLRIGTPVATLPGALRYWVSAGTGRPDVSIL